MALVLTVVPPLFATIVLIGWATGDEGLKRLGLATVTMNPTTASGFLALGLGLLLRRFAGRRGQLMALIPIAAAAALGGVKLFELISGHHLGIDTFLFSDRLSVGYVRPSRIAPNAALCFLLIGLALLIETHGSLRATVAAQVLALATGLIATFAIVGYLYGVGAFYVVSAFFPMAIHTAIAFLCLAGFVLLHSADKGLIAPISDQGPAGRISRALLPAAIVLPVSYGWLRQLGERAGLYTAEIGVALMVMVNVLTLVVLIWWTAKLLLASDTRRRQAEADLARMANHDFLTGLANRGRFMDRLLSRMSTPRRRKEDAFAVVYMDLDGFKQVNDRLGHAAGDQLLRDVAAHLVRCGRSERDLLARLGGDEFGMLVDQVDSDEAARQVGQRIMEGMPQHFGPPGQEVPVGMSVGIVVAGLRHQSPEALLAEADQALYGVKRDGKGRFSVYTVQKE